MKYQEGTRIGPKKVLFIKRVKDERKGSYGLFECYNCKQPFKARLDHVCNGVTYNCKNCRGEKYRGSKNNNFKDFSNKRIGKLSVISYAGSTGKRSLWNCKCDCGKEIVINSDLLSRELKTSCGYCNYKSRGEHTISYYLSKLGITFIPQKTFENCKDKRLLPFDFYIPKYNCCIEYDGTSHYQANKYGSWNTEDNIKKTQEHDLIKNNFCMKEHINLIRIPYWELNDINEDYLLDRICRV